MSGFAEVPPSIDYDGELLNQIRVAVVDGLHKIPHGGIEIGGLLLGERIAHGIRITGWQAISCEHAFGPSFTLSERDEAELRELLASAAAANLQVVGWFHSHTRSNLQFTDRDQALHTRFFPEPWQVALVMRPAMLQPTRAAFFRRGVDGSWGLHADEFLLEAPEKPSRSADDPASQNGELEIERYRSVQEVVYRATVVPWPANQRWRNLGRAAVAAAGIAVLSGLLFAAWSVSANRSADPIALQLEDNRGQVKISWNSESTALEDAQEGRLTIRDGTESTEHRLTSEDLKRGSMQYLRTADNVQVRLTVFREGKQPTEEWTSFIGPSAREPAAAPAEVQAKVDPADTVETEKEKAAEEDRIRALRIDEARLRAEMQRLEQARISAEQERALHARAQAERERRLQRMAEETKTELNRLQQLKSAATAPSPAPPVISVSQPAQAPAVPKPEADLARTAPPAAPPPAREPEPLRYSGPDSGRLIWTGDLPKNGILSIDEMRASLGVLTGRIPRQPVRIRAYPAELSEHGITIFTSDPKHAQGSQEPPSRQNGWNQTTYKWAPGRAADLTVLEGPGARNDWRKIVLRNDSKRLSIIVLDWELLRSARR